MGIHLAIVISLARSPEESQRTQRSFNQYLIQYDEKIQICADMPFNIWRPGNWYEAIVT